MVINRKKNAARNVLYGSVLRFYNIVVPFIIRTALIYVLGVQYAGLNGLFTSVLSILNLAELGVGGAMVYSMYKPIVEDDKNTICALMGLYRKYYRIIGIVILVAGLSITPLIPRLIKTGTLPPDVNIYFLYLMNLGATVLSYWLYAYKNCLITAHQREDIASKISIISSTITYCLQIICIIAFKNYYLFSLLVLLGGILNNILTAYVVDKIYPEYKPSGTLIPTEITTVNQRVKDLFTSKVGTVVYDSADTIVISAFLGMTSLAVYQNYFFILNAVNSFIIIIFNSCRAGIGNSIILESKEKVYSDLKVFTLLICWISIVCSSCFLCLYQPVMELWMGKELLLAFPAVICFTVYFYIRQINSLLNMYKDAAGIWHEDRLRPLAAAMANLILNLVLVHFWGVYGVLLSTVMAILFVGMPWLVYNLFHSVFEFKFVKGYISQLASYTVYGAVICTATFCLCNMIKVSLLVTVVLRIAICTIIPNGLLIFIFRFDNSFKRSLLLINDITKQKFWPLIRRFVK